MKPFSACVLWRVLFAFLVLRAGTTSAQTPAEYNPLLKISTQSNTLYFNNITELKEELEVYESIFQTTPVANGPESYVFATENQKITLAVQLATTPAQSLNFYKATSEASLAEVQKFLESKGWQVITKPTRLDESTTIIVLEDKSKRNRIGVLHNPNYPFVKRDSPLRSPKTLKKKR